MTEHGEQFVIILGTSTTLVLSADSLAFQRLRSLSSVVTLVKGQDRFGLTILVVQVMSHRYFHAFILECEVDTVIIVKTREYAVKLLKVRMNDKKINMLKKMREATKLHLTSSKDVGSTVHVHVKWYFILLICEVYWFSPRTG